MKIIALPDLHVDLTNLTFIGEALTIVDVVLLVGDLTNGGSADDASQVVQAIQRFNLSILTVPGNWDKPEVDAYLSQEKINLHRRRILIDGLSFIGMGLSLPGIVPTPNEITEADFERFFEETASDVNPDIPEILVCHQPPYNTRNDLTQRNIHVGSKAVREFIKRTQPLICFTGHIHEGIGIDQVGRTKIVNPGPLSAGSYAYAKVTQEGFQAREIVPVKH
ncbi:MAG TPA: metallophosphoesterase [Anaerolineales bacterium]